MQRAYYQEFIRLEFNLCSNKNIRLKETRFKVFCISSTCCKNKIRCFGRGSKKNLLHCLLSMWE